MARKFEDISEHLDKANSYCLNEDPSHNFGNLFIGDGTLLLKSEADEQLIIHVEFKEAVKLHSIALKAPNDDTAPRVLKLFVNRNNLGFSDVVDIEPVQQIELSQEQLDAGSPIELRFVKFQRVTALTLFVEENNGGDISTLSSLRFFGEPIAGTNMNDLKSSGHDH
ncbi:thioredoxin-like protein [Achlya hypogyna]|uniref:Thioredoxin-like protein n=1 Tax=Achlya hypogyna TaxID=1202772 RepID=A0A1V9Z8E4_ACHHY|nr:thioredoxin-like protein [Achlya hypogyna]